MTKLDVLNAGLHAWRPLPPALFRVCLALWEMSDSEPQVGEFVLGRAKTATIATYCNMHAGHVRKLLARLRTLGILDTRTEGGRYLDFRLHSRAPALQETERVRDSSASAGATTIYPVVETQFSSPSTPPNPPSVEVGR